MLETRIPAKGNSGKGRVITTMCKGNWFTKDFCLTLNVEQEYNETNKSYSAKKTTYRYNKSCFVPNPDLMDVDIKTTVCLFSCSSNI